MSEIKDFDAIIEDERRMSGEGPRFKLLGLTWQALVTVPAAAMREFARTDATLDTASDFLTRLIVPEQREAFAEALNDDSISTVTLNKIIEFLMEKYSGRPTNEGGSSEPSS